ncbi:related to PIF1-DNA helicase involved in mitochondrial DNA repair and telomere length control [Serendipita indica DSM 11827]|uniref:ATP-dependent DNA helicase PIF1 n=1 Tax=Serendipita indica (strain DSM 11827) TaxID=1109443 RepID=G4TCR9_SERID|nr:related to PIF1-DNA helicase involved in mitochondrial DNA repair and telomere length control [Serendipita indica DSM 11827]
MTQSGLRAIKRFFDDDEEEASPKKSSQASIPIPWSASPIRPVRPTPLKNTINTEDLFSKIKQASDSLLAGEKEVIKAKQKLDQKIAERGNSMKSRGLETASSRPPKRKSEVVELSDSEDEPTPKRRHVQPPQASVPPATAASTAVKVMPWEQDHKNMKLPADNQPLVTNKPKVSKPLDLVNLSTQQKNILSVVMEGKNVFFTGSAGTGKSVLLRRIIKELRSKYSKSQDVIAITASTGIAACNIGGVTLHSFAGVGLGAGTPAELAAKIKKNQKASSRWSRTKVLIIDEISMLEGDFFDKLEKTARIVRRNHADKPFGGIQLVLTGDFFQLPPVTKGSSPKFAFNAESWSSCLHHTFNLTKVFRQKDQAFVDILNEMRRGIISDSAAKVFLARSGPLPVDEIEPTELFPRREDVDRANHERLQRLTGKSHEYVASDGGSAEERTRANVLANFMAPARLVLKKGAQVMMIKNVDEQLVNGTVGKVIDFKTESEWADSQRGYGSSLEGDNEADASKPKDKSKSKAQVQKWPVVEWKIVGSRHTRTDLIRAETFKIEGPNNKVEVSRMQLPLILAWAMSIHKSQGQTLERVKVDLNKVFEKGQAYVAISRATSLEGLQVVGFQKNKVFAHPAVIEWSKTLSS